jgi:hypothetical protein
VSLGPSPPPAGRFPPSQHFVHVLESVLFKKSRAS